MQPCFTPYGMKWNGILSFFFFLNETQQYREQKIALDKVVFRLYNHLIHFVGVEQ